MSVSEYIFRQLTEVCMNTCVSNYPCACIHTHTYIHTTYIHTYIHSCKHTYKYTFKQRYLHTNIHTYTHTCIHTYTPVCIQIYRHRQGGMKKRGIMMIVFIAFNNISVPLLEGLCRSNPYGFEFSVSRSNLFLGRNAVAVTELKESWFLGLDRMRMQSSLQTWLIDLLAVPRKFFELDRPLRSQRVSWVLCDWGLSRVTVFSPQKMKQEKLFYEFNQNTKIHLLICESWLCFRRVMVFCTKSIIEISLRHEVLH